MQPFEVVSEFAPAGDQPEAIKQILNNFEQGKKNQVLLGVTGSGKTFTMAKVIEKLQKPALIIAHNKTLTAQLASEFQEFFPKNAVDYYVSYFDYYQPECYMPKTNTYIEKDSQINEEIEKFRHKTTTDLMTRNDIIVVASVSCIYGLGSPSVYRKKTITLKVGDKINLLDLMKNLTELQYSRDDFKFERGLFRVRGDILELRPIFAQNSYRFDFLGNEIESITEIDPISGHIQGTPELLKITPKTHFLLSKENLDPILAQIESDLKLRYYELKAQGQEIYAERLKQRTNYDLDMIRETGYCNGMENYSPYFDRRSPGEAPTTLIDYFPKDFITFIDESHITIPQVGGMYNGDRSRKTNLINYGFRLPRALDHRPLKFEEFEQKLAQTVFVSATPRAYEIEKSQQTVVEQIIRPTGLLDPVIETHPIDGQMDHLLEQIKKTTAKNERVLVTTITKKFSENVADFLEDCNVKVSYLHSEITTLERVEILRDLRLGKIDVVVGVNLLREGIDLPEVSLVAILDADKQGFLRSRDALVQTIGRASRNSEGRVVMYADRITEAMRQAIEETERRRKIQMDFNTKHGITPQTIVKEVKNIGLGSREKPKGTTTKRIEAENIEELIKELGEDMKIAVKERDYEKAADLRDEVAFLREQGI